MPFVAGKSTQHRLPKDNQAGQGGSQDPSFPTPPLHSFFSPPYPPVPPPAAKFIYDFTQSHDHGEEPPAYPYMQIRNKEFPWGNDNLFTKKHHDH
jgi:hypothetical protein